MQACELQVHFLRLLLEGPAPLALALPKSHGFPPKKQSCYKTGWIREGRGRCAPVTALLVQLASGTGE